jgi:hypothetical protein
MKTVTSKSSSSADKISFYSQSASGAFLAHERVNATGGLLAVTSPKLHLRGHNKKVVNAVYGHIRALRTLGRVRVSSREIANALSLPVNEVSMALKILRNKGVRAI